MGILDAVAGRMGFVRSSRLQTVAREAVAEALHEDRKRGQVRVGAQLARRGFESAKMGRLNAGWTTEDQTLNHNVMRDLRVLRARSRQMARDNDYAKHFLRMCKTNIVGHAGVQLQVQALGNDGRIDELDSSLLESLYAEFSRPGNFEVTGKLARADCERLMIETVARDGEMLIEEIWGRGPFGYQLRMLDPALLDFTMNKDLDGDRKIRMGVELDAMRKPVAYHLLSQDANDPITGSYMGSKHVRVVAENIIHAFLVEDVDQIRGVPWMHTILSRTNQLHGFEEAAVVAARVGASKMGFFKSPDGDMSPLAGDSEGSGEGDGGQGELIEDAEPGHFAHLPPGFEFQEFNPDYPHAHYGSFVKSCLRGISAGLGVSYNNLANDLEGVNYSSMRAGTIEERELWKALQGWLIGQVHFRVYANWLKGGLASGRIPLPATKYAKFNAPVWQGRRWPWVDPKNDVDTKIAEINAGLTSRSRVMREQGVDPEEVWLELEAEKKRLADILPQQNPPQSGFAASGGPNDNGNN
jgi:lambda family phage portal protein